MMTRTRSIGTPKLVATHCAITASAPWPCSETPVWQKIAPVASRRNGAAPRAHDFAAPPRRAVLRRDFRAADAVEGGARVGHLDEAPKPQAPIDAPLAELRLLGAQ